MATSKTSNARIIKIGRDARDGRFIPVEQARSMGDRAIVETRKVITKPKK